MTALEASHESRKPVIRCPYCIEGGGFKVMIGQGGGDWYMCARCGHLTLPTDPVFECTCAQPAAVSSSELPPICLSQPELSKPEHVPAACIPALRLPAGQELRLCVFAAGEPHSGTRPRPRLCSQPCV